MYVYCMCIAWSCAHVCVCVLHVYAWSCVHVYDEWPPAGPECTYGYMYYMCIACVCFCHVTVYMNQLLFIMVPSFPPNCSWCSKGDLFRQPSTPCPSLGNRYMSKLTLNRLNQPSILKHLERHAHIHPHTRTAPPPPRNLEKTQQPVYPHPSFVHWYTPCSTAPIHPSFMH